MHQINYKTNSIYLQRKNIHSIILLVIKLKFIQGNYENTIIIQKSRFIAEAYRVNNIEEINEILASIKKKYYDATHHCYAYRLGDQIQKMSDDGEPAKTAGAPMLDVLLKQDITNILVVVTRYFGGILLGAGGLVRAYSSATSSVLEQATFYKSALQTKFRMTVSYSAYQTLLKVLSYITIEKTSFLSEVIIEAHCSKKNYEQLQKDIFTYKLGETGMEYLGEFQLEIPLNTSS
ncbi:MAG: YigZ family protein [Anaeroplasmataceae bacterium]|nr:YigZ family protein [Anaeroplasmataceae bacterium]